MASRLPLVLSPVQSTSLAIYMYHFSVISYKNLKSVNQGVYLLYLNDRHRHSKMVIKVSANKCVLQFIFGNFFQCAAHLSNSLS